jgi:para-aminobenzoate synthetase/4-amino-4-deoxychorismate lyase
VYETLLVEHGEPALLDEHLARLALSLRTLYGIAVPADLRERARSAAGGHDRARLRIDAIPGEEITITVTAAPAAAQVRLRPVIVAGGLGAHKWRDRTLLEAHEADDPATMPLLLDADGLVLETSRASVVIRAADGRLYTPPADGRILPGVTAAHAQARPRVLTLDDLESAPELYVASALRGLQPARLAG